MLVAFVAYADEVRAGGQLADVVNIGIGGGELRLEDATGQLVRKLDFGSAPLLAATFSARS